MNLENLEKVAQWLEAGGDDGANKFNMVDWRCGTSCCIAGYAATLHEGYRLSPSIRAMGVSTLGLDWETADSLFLPMGEKLEDITTERAAAVVRHLMATGKVDWRIPA